MTVTATIPTRHNYIGNDVATSFSYTLKIDDQDHIKLVHTDSAGVENALADPLVVDVDYTVNGVGDVGGGTVDFPKAGSVYDTLATGEKLSLIYDQPIEQTTDLPNTGRVFNETVEAQMDYMTILINQLKEKLDRAIKLPLGSSLVDIFFAEGISAENRKNKVNVWDGTGTALELLAVTPSLNVAPIAVKGDIAQGDDVGDPEKLAIGPTGTLLSPVSGKLAYKNPRNLTTVKGSDIASAAALVVPDSLANYFDVTGTNDVTSITATNLAVGAIIYLHFDGILTFTHHATDLILPNGLNIITNAGLELSLIQYETDKYRLIGMVGQPDPTPAGIMSPYGGSSAPSGWLLCDGTTGLDSVADTSLAALFAAIGTTFGGTGSSDFDLPDMRGNIPLGKDNMGGTPRNRVTHVNADTVGLQQGEENHTLNISEMPGHRHRFSHGLTFTGAGGGSDAKVNTGTARDTLETVGGDNPHNNMPPYMTFNYIIKK